MPTVNSPPPSPYLGPDPNPFNSQAVQNISLLTGGVAQGAKTQETAPQGTGSPISAARLRKRPNWANKPVEPSQIGPAASASLGGPPWTTKSIAEATRSRFIDANGQPFVTLDSPEVLEARCANELLLEAVREQSLPVAELFVMSPHRSRETAKIGSNLNGEWFTLMRLGEHVHIGNDVNLLGHGFIEIHDKVQLGNGVTIDTIGHPNDPALRHTAFTGTVIVQEGAQIGAGTVIVARAGQTLVIGKNAKIANDSIVLKSVADEATVGGVPAKAIKGANVCSMQQEKFRPEGYTVIDTLEQVLALFGAEADIKLPIFIKGDPKRLKVDGTGRIGINREAMFDLEGDLTIHPPFQMASRASLQVLPGASAALSPGSFLYTACQVVAKDKLRIGNDGIVAAGARVDRDVEDGTIVVGNNRVSGRVTDKTYAPVPDQWKDRNSLPPKVEDFRKYKTSKAGMSFEEIKQFAVNSTRDLFKYRTLPFAPESLFMSDEFSKLEKQS
jgi:acetyltransferase-like isoleucine patch superfamily enzyme